MKVFPYESGGDGRDGREAVDSRNGGDSRLHRGECEVRWNEIL